MILNLVEFVVIYFPSNQLQLNTLAIKLFLNNRFSTLCVFPFSFKYSNPFHGCMYFFSPLLNAIYHQIGNYFSSSHLTIKKYIHRQISAPALLSFYHRKKRTPNTLESFSMFYLKIYKKKKINLN